MSKISERLKYARIEQGYCLICGEFGKLSKDHVPPKCVIRPGIVEQLLMSEHQRNANIKGVAANNGSVFKTVCSSCNNGLSIFDSEINRVTKGLSGKIERYLTQPFSPYNFVSHDVNSELYLKGMIGHILTAAPNTACIKPRDDAPFFKPLSDYVLGVNDDVFKTHSFHYWFYPNKINVSGSIFSMLDTSSTGGNAITAAACLYFYPVAILITERGHTFPEISGFAREVMNGDGRLTLDLHSKNFNYSLFPFYSLRSTVYMSADAYITVSYAKK